MAKHGIVIEKYLSAFFLFYLSFYRILDFLQLFMVLFGKELYKLIWVGINDKIVILFLSLLITKF